MKISRILIVADHNDPSSAVVEYGFSLASDLGAKVTLLGVIDPALAIGNPDAGVFPDDAIAKLKAGMQSSLDKIKAAFGDDANAEIIVSGGNIASAIVDRSVYIHADLIIIGIHSHSAWGKLFSRDVSESVIATSPVPVCIVPSYK